MIFVVEESALWDKRVGSGRSTIGFVTPACKMPDSTKRIHPAFRNKTAFHTWVAVSHSRAAGALCKGGTRLEAVREKDA
jgi:hypothetical protein